MVPVDGGVLVVAVGIVGPKLARLMAEPVKARVLGVGVLDELFERQPCQTAQVTIAFRDIERVARRSVPSDDSAGIGEFVAETFPQLGLHAVVTTWHRT